jgi:hypothetical protein
MTVRDGMVSVPMKNVVEIDESMAWEVSGDGGVGGSGDELKVAEVMAALRLTGKIEEEAFEAWSDCRNGRIHRPKRTALYGWKQTLAALSTRGINERTARNCFACLASLCGDEVVADQILKLWK